MGAGHVERNSVTRDELDIVLIASAWAGAVGVVGLALAWSTRQLTLRWRFALVALVAVGAVVAGVVGTARAMFLSDHDFQVVLWVVVAAGLVATGFAILIARQVIADSKAMQVAARSLGESGVFDTPVPSSAELAKLAAELKATSDKLAASRARERSLETSRRELIAWVSHDLRTPLAGLRAMAEALEDDIADDPQRYHRQIRENVDRMTRMVDDLFELSRIHSGVLPLEIEALPLDAVVNDALVANDAVARSRGVRLDGFAEPNVYVHADPRELSRVVANLLVNAIRHTPSDGVVALNAVRDGDEVEISVRDECGGIDEGDLDRVFDVAWTGTPARTPGGDGGSGLGLAIVRGIVEAHRGTVTVHNVEPGCQFAVRLPA
jgi:signal transduction histidine kinase